MSQDRPFPPLISFIIPLIDKSFVMIFCFYLFHMSTSFVYISIFLIFLSRVASENNSWATEFIMWQSYFYDNESIYNCLATHIFISMIVVLFKANCKLQIANCKFWHLENVSSLEGRILSYIYANEVVLCLLCKKFIIFPDKNIMYRVL